MILLFILTSSIYDKILYINDDINITMQQCKNDIEKNRHNTIPCIPKIEYIEVKQYPLFHTHTQYGCIIKFKC